LVCKFLLEVEFPVLLLFLEFVELIFKGGTLNECFMGVLILRLSVELGSVICGSMTLNVKLLLEVFLGNLGSVKKGFTLKFLKAT
jgi:hypothetical protein